MPANRIAGENLAEENVGGMAGIRNDREMKRFLLEMEIVDNQGDDYGIIVSGLEQVSYLIFNVQSKRLAFSKFLKSTESIVRNMENIEAETKDRNQLEDLLINNELQFRKILHNKRRDTFYQGFKLKFVLRDQKDVISFNDKSKILVLDKRKGKYESYALKQGEEKITEVYTDGSFLVDHDKGAYALIIRNISGEYRLYQEQVTSGSSNLMEMLAALKALELLRTEEKIRIITDSQYVRKGLTEWIFNWKLNDWRTANNEPVKNIEYWQRFDQLTDQKYIELQWVRGHTDHFENTMCHLYAGEEAKK